MAKRMRRLRGSKIWDRVGQRTTLYEHTKAKGHYGKEMRDRRRRGWLAKVSRKKNQRVNRRKRGRRN